MEKLFKMYSNVYSNMIAKRITTRGTRLYDGNIAAYVSHVNHQIKEISALVGEIILSAKGGREECLSIDKLAGLPEGYHMDIVPKRPNGNYFTSLVIYVPGQEVDTFVSNGEGVGRKKVEFGNLTRKAIYDILMREDGMKDLTLAPVLIKRGRYGIQNEAEVQEMRVRVIERYQQNQTMLWLYYTTHFDGQNGSPAFVVHIPKDPYNVVHIIKRVVHSMQNLPHT